MISFQVVLSKTRMFLDKTGTTEACPYKSPSEFLLKAMSMARTWENDGWNLSAAA